MDASDVLADKMTDTDPSSDMTKEAKRKKTEPGPRAGLVFNFTYPPELQERTRVIAKRLGRSLTEIIREGLREKVEAFEEKFRLEDERAEAEKAKKHLDRMPRRLLRNAALRDDVTAPIEDTAPAGGELASTPSKAVAVCAEYAEKILLAGNDEYEVKRLIVLAMGKIKRECPLTYPKDHEMLAMLEREVIRQRDEGPTETRSFDALVAGVVGAAKPVKSE